jgi:aminopeptidase N
VEARHAVAPAAARGLGYADGPRTIQADLEGDRVYVREAVGLPAPLFVLPTGEGWAYGGFELDPTSLAYLSTSLPAIADPLTRGSAWVTLWDALLDGAVSPNAFVDLAVAALPKETDEQLTSRVLGYAATRGGASCPPTSAPGARPRRAPPARRAGAGVHSEPEGCLVRGAPERGADAGHRGLAASVWAKTETVPGLPLAEADYTSLALELAVREVDGWKGLLTEQLGRIENPDRKGRFEFVMPALSADPKERDAWFRSLADVKNRRREPWVLEGLNYLHHPLRARASAGYVTPSLEMLWEIQKTGDIFFPKRWLDATLGGHSSTEVAGMVRQFLAALPANYPERLKNITLQSADELFRVEAARRR